MDMGTVREEAYLAEIFRLWHLCTTVSESRLSLIDWRDLRPSHTVSYGEY